MQIREMPFNESFHEVSNTNDWTQLAMVVIIGLFLLGILFLVYKLISKPSTTKEPLEIAKERFAKGEISAEEFADIKKELK